MSNSEKSGVGTYQSQKPFYCRICDTGFLSHVRLVEHDCNVPQEGSSDA